MRTLMFLVISILTVFSCGNKGSTTKSQQVYDEVMKIHDDVMPKMRDIRQYSKKLKKIEGSEKMTDVQNALTSLNDAHESMMDWMAQFKMPKNISETEEIKYLSDQMISVGKMSEQIYDALDLADSTLKTHQ